MRHIVKQVRTAAFSAMIALPLLAGSVQAQQAATAPAPKHHSKLKGALVGAAAGHMMGGHAVAGAAAGAMIQHHRNRKVHKPVP